MAFKPYCEECASWHDVDAPHVASDEVCDGCAHCVGPLFLMCVHPESEFEGGPVDPLGFCDKFEAMPFEQQRNDT